MVLMADNSELIVVWMQYLALSFSTEVVFQDRLYTRSLVKFTSVSWRKLWPWGMFRMLQISSFILQKDQFVSEQVMLEKMFLENERQSLKEDRQLVATQPGEQILTKSS